MNPKMDFKMNSHHYWEIIKKIQLMEMIPMTMEILIRNTENRSNTGYMVHGEHECDMYDFLKNHPHKHDVSNHTCNYEGVEWFRINLTSNDVEFIKKTSWYRNTSWDYPQVDDELKEETTIEVFLVEPVIPKK